MTMQITARGIGNTGAEKRYASPGRVRSSETTSGSQVTWRDVLRALTGDDARCHAVHLYRAQGWTADDFDRRAGARQAMADALTRTEDFLELRRRVRERDRVQAVRRRLEAEAT